jgi:signal transduction histidine kinase
MNELLKRWYYSVYFRLTLIVIAILVLTLVTVGICISFAVDREVTGFSQAFERARMIRLGQLINESIESDDPADLESIIDTVNSFEGWKVILAEGDRRTDVTPERISLPLIEGFTVLSDGRNLGVIQFADSGETTAETNDTLQWSQISSEVNQWLIWIGLGAVVIGILLISVLLRRTLRPVRALTSAAERLGDGDLSQRVPVSGHSEMGELSKTFNSMANGLEKAEEQRRNLMADIAHELRTPLFNAQGYLEAMRDGTFKPDMNNIDVVYQQVKQLTALVEDVRLLALAESQALQLNIRPYPVKEVIERCAESFQPQASLKGITLGTEIAADIPDTSFDKTRIEQVISNLLQNAIFHTPSGGQITIKAQMTADNRLSVTVGDTGPGIQEDDLAFVFDRFYKADRSRSADTGGSGLGLAIAKELVEAHGGVIYAESEVGKGSRFTFELLLGSP